MLTYVNQSIFDLDVETLVNPVNCVGVMGKGLALEFKKKYYDNFLAYQEACKNKQIDIGKCYVHQMLCWGNPKYIINFPTKYHWKEDSDFDNIVLGVENLIEIINEYNVNSIALPALGCGLGKLNWIDVKHLYDLKFFNNSKIHVFAIPPQIDVM